MAPLRSHKLHARRFDTIWLAYPIFWPILGAGAVIALVIAGTAIFAVIRLVGGLVAMLVKLIEGHGREQPRQRRDVERNFGRELPVLRRSVHNLSMTTDELIRNPQGRPDSPIARVGDLPI